MSLSAGNFFANAKSAVSQAGGLKGVLQQLTGEADRSGSAISKIGSGLGNFAKTAAGITAGAAAAVGAAAVGIGTAAVNIGTEYKTALNTMAAQTGISGSALSDFDGIMKSIYSQNYGESFDDIAASIATVTQTARTIDPSAIEGMTINAIALRDTFGYDIQESMRAANMLVDQFGMTGDEAFNLIAQGAQQGLDKNGDLLDSINEYSVHFKQIGIDAEGMFNSMANGAFSGTFSVDKLGDAVKEFGIRVKDGTGDEAFKTLGLSVNSTKKAFLEGGEAGQAAFKSVTDALFSMNDKVKQNELGVQLFGTMWEDLGAEGVKALSDIDGEFDRTYDSMNQIKNIRYDDLGSAFEGLKRIMTSNVLLPIAEELTPAVSDCVNNIQAIFADGAVAEAISGVIRPAIEWLVNTALPAVSNVLGIISSALNTGGISGFTEGLTGLVSYLTGGLPAIVQAAGGIVESLGQGIASAIPGIIPVLLNGVLSLISNLSSLLPTLASAGAGILQGLAQGIISSFPLIMERGPEIVGNVVSGIVSGVSQLAAAAMSIIAQLVSYLANNAPEIIGAGVRMILNIVAGIAKALPDLLVSAGSIVKSIISTFGNSVRLFIEAGANLIKGLAQGIVGGFKDVISGVTEGITGTIDKVKALLGIHSPSRVFQELGMYTMQGYSVGIKSEVKGIKSTLDYAVHAAVETIRPRNISLAEAGGIIVQNTAVQGSEANIPFKNLLQLLRRYIIEVLKQNRGGNTIQQYITINAEKMGIEELADRFAELVYAKLQNI